MQFAVPQFTEVEDRLIGPLTLKQFLVLLAAGGVVLFFWSILGPSLPFFLVAFPIGGFGVAVAMGKYNGRPLFIYLMPFASYLSSTKIMVFKRETAVTSVSRSRSAVQDQPKAAVPADLEPAESRLKKLAYLMDRKSEEEGDIISKDMRQDIIVPEAHKVDLGKAFTAASKGIRDQIMSTARQLDGSSSGHKPAKPTAKPHAATKSKEFDPSSFLQI